VALGSKAHVCKSSTLFHHVELADDAVLTTFVEDAESFVPRPCDDSLVVFPDTLPMPVHFDSLCQRAMLIKQVCSVGVRSWLEGL
jgi:hypothetical protein